MQSKLTEDRLYLDEKLEFEKSLELRNFEITLFWRRAWFFGALLVAIGGGYFEIYKEPKDNSFCIYLSFLGLLVSFLQCLMNRGSKYWQERWEYKTKSKESKLKVDVTLTERIIDGIKEKAYIDACIIAKKENFLVRSARFSVSKITFLIWDIITIFWLFIWISDWNISKDTFYFEYFRFWAFLFHFVVIGYILLFTLLPNPENRKKFGGMIFESLNRTLAKNLQEAEKTTRKYTMGRDDLEKDAYK